MAASSVEGHFGGAIMGRMGKGSLWRISLLWELYLQDSLLNLWANACGKWVNSIVAAEKHRIQETELETGNGKILRVPGDHLDKPPLFTYSKGETESQSE